MATLEQKQELIDVLKFTPRTYKLEIGAYGGECYMGRVDRETYDFFKKHKIDLDEYASGYDEEVWDFVPSDKRPFPPGAPFECDNLLHASGPTLDAGNYITIYDEQGNEVFQCSLDYEVLDNHKIEVNCWEEEYVENQPDGTIVFWGGQGEKGLCYGGEIELTAPFDPSKLKLNYSDADGWCIINGVEYDGEDIENYDLSTTGKWGENKFIIVGGSEEVYEGVSRDDIDNEENDEGFDAFKELTDSIAERQQLPKEPEVTEWFEKDIKPAYKGRYEVVIDAPWPNGGPGMAEWTGRSWKENGKKVSIHKWRGLAENPNE